jgi:aspartate kinase
MRSHPGVAAKVFGVLAREGVNIDMISTSPIKISCVIDHDRVQQAVQLLHSAFELSGPGTLNEEKPFSARASQKLR